LDTLGKKGQFRISSAASLKLKAAAEAYLGHQFVVGQKACVHRGKKELGTVDMAFARFATNPEAISREYDVLIPEALRRGSRKRARKTRQTREDSSASETIQEETSRWKAKKAVLKAAEADALNLRTSVEDFLREIKQNP
jgi:hypothetical protein